MMFQKSLVRGQAVCIPEENILVFGQIDNVEQQHTSVLCCVLNKTILFSKLFNIFFVRVFNNNLVRKGCFSIHLASNTNPRPYHTGNWAKSLHRYWFGQYCYSELCCAKTYLVLTPPIQNSLYLWWQSSVRTKLTFSPKLPN